MKGKTAIVTGSTSGIGRGIAEALAAAGSDVMLNGFGDVREIAALQREIAARHAVRIGYSAANMSKPDEIRALVADTVDKFGRLDILVNNAGIQHVAPVHEFPDAQWDAVLAINLSSAFHACKAAIPLMRKAGWGRIVNIASAHGLVGSQNKVAYVAAKHGIIGLTKVVALENANHGITCNAICPGWVLTPLVQKQIEERASRNGNSVDEEKLALLSEKQPMKQFTTPEQLGALTLFLCGDAAATMTGSAYSVDGGWVAQ